MENGYVNIDIFNFVYYLSRLTTLQGDGFLHGKALSKNNMVKIT